MPSQTLFRVSFVNQNQIYEVYARRVYQADLYGFVVVEEFVFGESSAIVVDPSEEKLKAEFENVQRSFIPMHAVIRIDEVEQRGTAKILPMKESGAKVTPLYPPKG
ncbi:hypothetical protein MIN45_P1730 [Methylomarinovum tepidoasis]|uniref:DUF1820 family protein n=1 Tax=Methylomarinovum tepidoasis TaxID=2840183 RepID=A0AAU9CSM5_9GAMM|nr:DUF1820 family protein [Methylomarinovum sp. IN45]BCX89358.1 hypothetical protein MIN45_P1730 [Methylomarinovum sp. IN45]